MRQPHGPVALGFRPDIEGLRAVSILAVVLYHARVAGFSGGFVGVDVFFVISGFLICRMLLAEAAASGRIDLWRFWSRRARRLLPNATLTLAAVLVIGIVLIPGFMRETLARDIVSVALYVSNYRFAAQAVDYFHFDDPVSPVLHFWSLSIEEQFYFAWPLILLLAGLLLRRSVIGAAAIYVLCAVWLASFAACVLLVRDNQPLAFFHAETRAWQLATGGLLAAYANCAQERWPAWAPRLAGPAMAGVGWLGLAAMAFSIVRFDDTMQYPGILATLPTFGVAAIIVAGLNGSALLSPARLLQSAILRWIGARSYSWYLWHWPLLVFAQTAFPDRSHAALLSLPLSLAVASLVYAQLEDPIRKGRLWPASPVRSLISAGAAIALLLAASGGFALLPQMGGTASAALLQNLKTAQSDFGRNYADNCHLDYDIIEQPECVYGLASASHRAVLFGDSHAAQWFPALEAAARAEGWQFNAWTKSSCPAVDVTIWYPPRRSAFTACNAWRAKILRALAGAQRPDVVFVSNLTDYSGLIADRKTGEVLRGGAADAAWRRGFRTVLTSLTRAGIPVVVIRDTPRTFKSFAACLAEGGGSACDRPRGQALGASPDLDVAREFGNSLAILDLSDRICDAAMCPTTRDGMLVYHDQNHLTATFAATLSADFRKMLASLSSRQSVDGDAR